MQVLARARGMVRDAVPLAAAVALFTPSPAGGYQERDAAGSQTSAKAEALLSRPARLAVENVPLKTALQELELRSGVPIAFSPKLLPDRRVSCSCQGATVHDAVRTILEGTGFEPTVLWGHVVIRRAASPPAPPPAPPPASPVPARPVAHTVPPAAAPPRIAARPLPPRQGTIAGQVISAQSLAPVDVARVHIPQLDIGALTDANGRYQLTNVPAGTHTVVVERIGYRRASQQVTVREGETAQLDFQLTQEVLALQEIVATGLIDPVAGVRSPIAVARVARDLIPVTAAGNAVQNLQGVVAGMTVNRASGQPGSEVTMMLRTPTSIRGTGAPLIVVDGVILGGSGTPSTINIESMDIESVEVIRGAAASSLYGSRAAAGVIAITTNRGRGVELGQTRFTARSEVGVSQALKYDYLASHHYFLMDPTNSFYVDTAGNRVERNRRVAPPLTVAFIDKPFPGPIYNNVDAITKAGGYRSNNFSIAGNTASTNFAIALNSYREEGALRNNDGYYRNSFRINVDHRFMEALNLSTSIYHGRDGRDELQGNPFDLAVQAPVDVDFTRKDENGLYLQQPDPNILVQNPLWTQATREAWQKRNRTLASGSLAWTPFNWITATGTAGYDRSDALSRSYVPKGTPANIGDTGELDGSLSISNSLSDTWNAEAQISLRRDFGALNVRTTVRGLMEYSHAEGGTRSGQGFLVYGVPTLANIPPENRNATSTEEDIRATGYLWDTAFDYAGRYIFMILGRRDGSSLFGPDNRFHNYYRVAGAWRIGEEAWFNVRNVNELKLSVARGTAGGRPDFNAQYETWSLNNGIPTKGNLGNRSLAPEHTIENEFSLNAILFNRVGIVLTHARQETRDQITPAPQSVVTGYTTQWVNAGTIAGHSTELEIEGFVVQRPKLTWNTRVVADHSNSYIKDWPIPCDATLAWRLFCTGEPVLGLFALHLLNGKNDGLRGALAKHRGGDALPYIDQFAVNDEGYVVWVGPGNSYRDGIAKNLWGTVSGNIGGRTYDWGHPIVEQDENGNNRRQLLGIGAPYGVGWINVVRLGNFNFHAHLHASIGGDANNRATWSLINSHQSREMDQAGKPDGLKKPVAYYFAAIAGNTDYYLDDASYLKLRTLSVNYRVGAEQLERVGLGRMGMRSLSLGLIARNVFTLTKFKGFDPEGALNLADRANSIGVTYPTTRSLTAEVSINF